MEKDDTPSTSRLVHKPGVWQLEVRSRDYGVGTVRIGELILTGTFPDTLRASITLLNYGDTEDEERFGD